MESDSAAVAKQLANLSREDLEKTLLHIHLTSTPSSPVKAKPGANTFYYENDDYTAAAADNEELPPPNPILLSRQSSAVTDALRTLQTSSSQLLRVRDMK